MIPDKIPHSIGTPAYTVMNESNTFIDQGLKKSPLAFFQDAAIL